MAQRILPSKDGALEQLSILINLLAVRGGGPIQVGTAEACDEEHDEGDQEALDLEAETSHPDSLSPSRSQLYDRFLNRLAEVFSPERDGRFVTAAVLAEREKELRVDIYVARNNGFNEAEDNEMIRKVQTSLNQLTGAHQGNVKCVRTSRRY